MRFYSQFAFEYLSHNFKNFFYHETFLPSICDVNMVGQNVVGIVGSGKPQQIPRAGIGIMLQPVQPDGEEMVVTRIIEGGTAHLSN